MNNRVLVFIFSLAKVAWIIFVAVAAVYGAKYGYTKNGIGGLCLGLVCGILVGAMSATIWAFIFYFIFRIGRFIFLSLKPKDGLQNFQASAAKSGVSPMTRREKVLRFFCGTFLIALGFGCAGDAATYNANNAQQSIIIFCITGSLFILGGLKLIHDSMRAA